MNASDFTATASGTLPCVELGFTKRLSQGEAAFRLWHQTFDYTLESPGTGQSTQGDWGGEALWRSPYYVLGGFRIRQFQDFRRASPDLLAVRGLPVFSLVLGTSIDLELSKQFYFGTDFLADMEPLGQVRGFGIEARLRAGYRRLSGLVTPEARATFTSAVAWVDPLSTRYLLAEVSFMLFLKLDLFPGAGISSVTATQKEMPEKRG